MRAAVLTYHGINVNGVDYSLNDHVALAEDLRQLHELGIAVRPLQAIVDALDRPDDDAPCVALSFDDGSWFDWYDLDHPHFGPQRGFGNILGDFAALHPESPVHATSFVIASPQARARLDQTCLIGRGWWGEEWWNLALASGRMAIESHSWDHHHDTLEARATGLPGGTFANLSDHRAADLEIRQASDYLDAALSQRRTRLFAYPYGELNDYLSEQYLPRHRHEHRLEAAFTTEPVPVSRGANRWKLGRYVCRQHWNSPESFAALLRDALGSSAP